MWLFILQIVLFSLVFGSIMGLSVFLMRNAPAGFSFLVPLVSVLLVLAVGYWMLLKKKIKKNFFLFLFVNWVLITAITYLFSNIIWPSLTEEPLMELIEKSFWLSVFVLVVLKISPRKEIQTVPDGSAQKSYL